MPENFSRPRLNVDITPEQDAFLKKYLPHSTKGLLFRALVDDLMEMILIDPERVIALIIARKLRAQAILKGWEGELDKSSKHTTQPS